MKIGYQEDIVVAFQNLVSGLFELFLFQGIEKAFLHFTFTFTFTTFQLHTNS